MSNQCIENLTYNSATINGAQFKARPGYNIKSIVQKNGSCTIITNNKNDDSDTETVVIQTCGSGPHISETRVILLLLFVGALLMGFVRGLLMAYWRELAYV